MKRTWDIRTIYLYLVSFVTLIMIIVGTVMLVQNTVEWLVPPPDYYPGPLETKMRMANEKADPALIEEQVKLEQERMRQQRRYQRARELSNSLALLLVAGPVYLYHWRKIQREDRERQHQAGDQTVE
ncbi:MAG: DUF5671 domain-containing protein [Actinobacteria bacterium]|nr:DUF5671 domain-containing protein [Actinomycetota bacterium]